MPIDRLKQVVRSRIGERGSIVHSVGTLVGGTALAQALTVAALPVLTRLYTPAEFSVLAVYASILGILVAVACLRLEIAIPLPEDDEDAASLLVLALASGLGLSLLVGLVVLGFHAQILSALQMPAFSPYIWMVPIGMWLASAYAAFQYWSTRRKKFSRIARTRMEQAVGGVGTQVGAGLLGAGPVGLLLGHMISGGAGAIGLARDAARHDREVIRGVTPTSMRKVLRQYSRFPKYSTLEALANTAGIQVPVIIIAALAIGPEAGFLMLATRLMAAPMALLGGSIAQVYLAHAPAELRAGRLGDFSARILSGLIKTGVGPLLFAGIVALPVSGFVFGREWERAGELVAWMTPWFVLQFLSSPVSMVMHVTGRQRGLLVVTLTGLFLRLGAMWLAYHHFRNGFSEVYAASGALFYSLCFVVFYRAAGVQPRKIIAALRSGLPHVLAWVTGGFVVRYLVGVAL